MTNGFVKKTQKTPQNKKEWDESETEYNLINALVEARKVKHITQKQLADRSGIDQSDISKIENGNANPALSTLKRLAEGLDMILKIEFIPKEL